MTDLIAVRVPTARDAVAAWDQLSASGDAVLPLSPSAPDAEVARVVAALRPAAILRPRPDGALRVMRLPGGAPVADGTALVVATSGSTGEPKGVVLSRAALDASTAASVDRLGCEPGERWLLCLPMTHVAGFQVLLRSRRLGTEPVVHDRFDVDAIAAVAAAGDAQHVSLVPTQLVRLLDAGAPVQRFRTILLGGARPEPALLARAADAGARVVVSYGMTETCGGCVYDGRPLDGVEARVHDDGHVALRGPVLMDGYRGRDDLTREVLRDGWFHTADRGRLDGDGRLEVLGRMDDVVITGGENVAVGPVADAVRTHPAVRDAVVVGRPDPEWGERLVAVCELTDGATLTLEVLRDHLRGRLSTHALPRVLVVVPALPRDAMGKVRRGAVDELLGG